MSSLSDSTGRSLQIVAGSSTTTFDGINKFTLRLPVSGFRSGRDEVALKSLTLYFSWPNISAAKQNNSFSYRFNGTVFPVVMDDGIWSFHDVNSYLQQVMIQNGHYMLDAGNVKQFFIQLTINTTLYCLSLVIQPVPDTLPVGWTNPTAIELSGNTPQLIIPSTFATFTGFTAGEYPPAPQTAAYQVNSGIPQVSDTTSLNLLCNLVDNSGFSISPNILTSFVIPSGQAPGSLVNIEPSNPDWSPIPAASSFTEVTVELVDQLRRPVTIRDPAGFVAIISLRRRKPN